MIPNASSLRLGTRITNALNGCFLFNLFDDAIADLLCLQTCTHGTSPKCYNNIIKIGADPNRGGKGGESAFYEAIGEDRAQALELEGKGSGWNCEKRFFVFLPECFEPIKRWQPRVYSIAACVGENCAPKQNRFAKFFYMTTSFFEGFCSPALKFRFQSDNPINLMVDQTFGEGSRIAGFTEQSISADRIGLYGSLSEGVNSQWGKRILSNPGQFAKGLLKLIAVIAIVAAMVFAAIYCSPVAIILMIYAAVKAAQILGRFFVPLLYNLKSS